MELAIRVRELFPTGLKGGVKSNLERFYFTN